MQRRHGVYIKYLLDNGIEEIYTQIWSGNYRVIGLMEKVGFVECHREKNTCRVRGNLYDDIAFKLNVKVFKEFIRHNNIISNFRINK